MIINNLIHSIKLKNFLSYGEQGEIINLKPLNVLIGPNASGKSNLIEAFGILRATPKDLLDPIREGGGISEWIWKGQKTSKIAYIEVTVYHPERKRLLRYHISFTQIGQRFELVDEIIEDDKPMRSEEDDVYFYYRYSHGNPVLNTMILDDIGDELNDKRHRRFLRREDLSPEQSVLAQKKDVDYYPELNYLDNKFSNIRLYREWNFGRYTPPRIPQKVDLPEDFLLEDASNLGLVLNNLQHHTETKEIIIKNLKIFYDGIIDITTKIQGGTVQIFLHEKNLKHPIPATRLSDGLLRYLCLLSLLCHPNPPPLICIEEPELGMHPDIIPFIADLLVKASSRTQLIITTHSDTLISALTEFPDCILVCERDEYGSNLLRLEKRDMEKWLEKYNLGELWRMGEIGGTRW